MGNDGLLILRVQHHKGLPHIRCRKRKPVSKAGYPSQESLLHPPCSSKVEAGGDCRTAASCEQGWADTQPSLPCPAILLTGWTKAGSTGSAGAASAAGHTIAGRLQHLNLTNAITCTIMSSCTGQIKLSAHHPASMPRLQITAPEPCTSLRQSHKAAPPLLPSPRKPF